MEPMNDDELRNLLRKWEAPPAPPGLERRILRRIRPRWEWLKWLFTGSVRIPVPVGLCVLCVLVLLALRTVKEPVSDLSDFQQVKEFRPRVVRTVYDSN